VVYRCIIDIYAILYKGEEIATRNEVKYFTKEKRARFMLAIAGGGNTRNLIMFKLFLCTGMRLSELNSLTVGKLKESLNYGAVGFTMGSKGEPIQVIQKLLGHSNLNTTRIYVEPDLDQITASMSRALGSV